MSAWLKALWLPLFLVIVPPMLFMIFVAGPRPTLALVTSLSLPAWYGVCALLAGRRVVARGVGGSKGAAAAGIVTATANVVLLCLMVLLWVSTPWGSTGNVGVIKFVQVLPFLLVFVTLIGWVCGWAGGRAAARRLRDAAA